MSHRNYKKSIPAKISELAQDIISFNQELEKLRKKKELLQSKAFLDNIAEQILVLDRHAKEVSELTTWKGAEAIHFMLDTPWGAPIVMNTTLLEAATIYPDETSDKSQLHEVLKQILKYAPHCEIPFLATLQQLSEEIRRQKVKS
ncbi:MAG: hypothetical protein JSR76_05430 [Verrucomicrobia bacterium]|nr:hypothetical protein [Verrucomicrobiota bacterium]